MSYEVELKEHYAEVRARITRARPIVVRRQAEAATAPALPPPATPEPPWPATAPAVIYDDATAIANLTIRPPFWRIILEEVAARHGVTVPQLLGPQRHRRIVAARHEACYRLHTETVLSLPQIGRILRKDHSTIIHGVNKHLQRMGMQ